MKLTNIFKEAVEYKYLCTKMDISEEIAEYVSKFDSPEQLLRSGGIPIDLLDKAAHGFSEADILQLKPSQLNIKWDEDMKNPIEQIRVSGKGKEGWARTVNLQEPIDVSYEDGKFWVEDGHHRYTAANILNRSLNVKLEIKDNPIKIVLLEAFARQG